MASVPSPPAALARPARPSPVAVLRIAIARLGAPHAKPAATALTTVLPPSGTAGPLGPGPGGEGCAALLGGAVALSSLYDTANAIDAPARAAILSDADLTARLESTLHGPGTPLFVQEFAQLTPFWQMAVVTVLDHPALALARPVTIGGYPAPDVLRAAIALAAASPPFDTIVAALERLASADEDAAP